MVCTLLLLWLLRWIRFTYFKISSYIFWFLYCAKHIVALQLERVLRCFNIFDRYVNEPASCSPVRLKILFLLHNIFDFNSNTLYIYTIRCCVPLLNEQGHKPVLVIINTTIYKRMKRRASTSYYVFFFFLSFLNSISLLIYIVWHDNSTLV
jgi:hypothetical protein